jgi:STE24 endopeptidase
MNEDKSARYHRLKRRAQVASLALVGGGLAAFTFAGGGHALAATVTRLAGQAGGTPPVRSAIAVALGAAALTLGLELIALPGAYYAGRVLDSRYGLSRQTAREWWTDHAKAGVLGLLMALVVAGVVYGSIALMPPAWWLAAGVALAALALLVAIGAPVLLFPLFYRFKPLEPGELPDRLTALAARAGTPVLGVYEWSLGDKTRAANAALVGMGPTRRVLLSDTLVSQYSADEIEVIIAHELAHHVHGDIWKGVAVEAAQGTLALLTAHVALVWLGPSLGISDPSDLGGMPLLALAAGAWSVVTSPLLLAMSRRHERRADRFALELTSKSDAFISAMRRLGTQNLADDAPSRVVQWLFHSHPPLGERVQAARRWAAERAPAG